MNPADTSRSIQPALDVAKNMEHSPGAVLPTQADSAQARAIIADLGESKAAERLSTNRQTLARIVACLPVRNATLSMIRMAMREVKGG